MSDPVREELLGYLLGALEGPEEKLVAARLEVDGQLRRALMRVRDRLEPLEPGRGGFVPPPGLAERTCRAVASHAESAAPATSGRRPMSPAPAPPSRGARTRWIDVAVAAGVFTAGWLLILPAVQSSRSNAQLLICQDNLRQIGVAMTQYSEHNNGFFPYVPARGRLSAAGIYAPILVRDRYVTDIRRFICPSSPPAGGGQFRIPALDELEAAPQGRLQRLLHWMGGSYGYHLGHIRDGTYHGTKNLRRTYFALVADTPGTGLPNRRSLNHGGRGQNVLFEYGGVRFVASVTPSPLADNIYINDGGLVAAGLHLNDSVIGSSADPPILFVVSH